MTGAHTGLGGMIRRIVSSVTASVDPEQGWPMNEATAEKELPKQRPLTVTAYGPNVLVPQEDKLLIFRTLTGIDTVPVVSRSGHAIRSAANIGIYTRVIRKERWAKKMYRLVRVISSICLGLQIIMSAAVTALGAANSSYNSITGLGACSTITASIVAYIKGSGQPQKLKHEETRWKSVREYIEQRERELCLTDCPLDVYKEVRIVEQMYQAVQDEFDVDQTPGQSQPQTCQASSSNIGMAPMSVRRRSDYVSFESHEPPQKAVLRPESTATMSSRPERRNSDSVPLEKHHKDG